MNYILCILIVTYGLVLFLGPLPNRHTWHIPQSVRISIFHTIFKYRIRFLSYFEQQRNISAEYRAFQEIILLHYPRLYFPHSPSKSEINQFRSTAGRIFTGLHPKHSEQTCKIEPFILEYESRKVLAYSIRDGDMPAWTETNQKFLLYIHGGGFVCGDIQTYLRFECYLSREYHMPVIHIEYGLAPESTALSAIDDVVTAYRSMLKYDSNIHQRMIAMGDCSGGLLWLRLIQIIIEQKQPVPLALVLLSPWVDISFNKTKLDYNTETHVEWSLRLVLSLREQAFRISQDKWGADYIVEFAQQLNKINPIDHSFQGFPPLYVIAGSNELFTSDAITLENKILQNNGQIALEISDELMHVYSIFPVWSWESKCSQHNIRTFIKQF